MSGELKKLDRTLERLLPKLSRGQKLARNLAASALVCVLAWAAAGYPLPTAEMEFRRLERTHLLPESEIVFTAGGDISAIRNSAARLDHPVRAQDGTELYLRGRWFAGAGETWAVIALVQGESYDRFLQVFPLKEEGPALLSFPSGYGYWREEGPQEGVQGETHSFFPLLLVNVPEGTDRAEVTIWAEGAAVTGPGWNMGSGVWLMTPDNQVLPYQGEGERSYVLRLYRADGSLLLEQSGTLEI